MEEAAILKFISGSNVKEELDNLYMLQYKVLCPSQQYEVDVFEPFTDEKIETKQ